MSTDIVMSTKAALPADVSKIAVLRANALGDFIFILPALRALRTTYPHAEIVLLGKQWHTDFVPGHVADVDRVVVVPPCPGVGEPEDFKPDQAQLEEFFTNMRAEEFDLALQLHGGGKYSNPFVNKLGAKVTAGSKTPDAEALDISIPYIFYQNEVLRHLEIASAVGARTEAIAPHITVTEQDQQEAIQATNRAESYIVLHPGASDPRRRWPAENFAEVAKHFLDKNYLVFVTGTPAEQVVVDQVVAHTNNRAIALCGGLSLGGLAGLLAGAELVISNDTGPLHLARAVGTKTIGIYWVGNYITAGPMRLYGNHSLLSWIINCPECGTPCVSNIPFSKDACTHTCSFVADVQVTQVLEAAQNLDLNL